MSTSISLVDSNLAQASSCGGVAIGVSGSWSAVSRGGTGTSVRTGVQRLNGEGAVKGNKVAVVDDKMMIWFRWSPLGLWGS